MNFALRIRLLTQQYSNNPPAIIEHNMQLVKKEITNSDKLCITNSHMNNDLPTRGEKIIYTCSGQLKSIQVSDKKEPLADNKLNLVSIEPNQNTKENI